MNLPSSSSAIFHNATGELSNLLRDIGLAAKRVNVEVNKAGLVDILGDAGTVNVQGEDVKKLDIFANNQFMGVFRHGISCAGIGSEELDDFVVFDDEISNNSKYVCLFDPLDGSGNIDVNVSIGTIFGVYRRVSERGQALYKGGFSATRYQTGGRRLYHLWFFHHDGLCDPPGREWIYLDPSIGEFTLSHPNIKCPEREDLFRQSRQFLSVRRKGSKLYRCLPEKEQRTMAAPIRNDISAAWWRMFTAT